MKPADPFLIQKIGDDVFDVGSLGVVTRIDQHEGLGPQFSRQIV